jgi:DNA repair protein RadC
LILREQEGGAVPINHWPEGERPREKGFRARRDGALRRGAPRDLLAYRRAWQERRRPRPRHADRHGSLNALFAADRDCHDVGRRHARRAASAAFELARRASKRPPAGDALGSPQAVRRYLQFSLAHRPHEVFVAVWLDAQHRVLKMQELFAGTLTQTSVYPREVVKDALRHNAAAVIFAHNHPSGLAEPSQADQLLTETLKRALDLVDVKVLDHFVVGRGAIMSFAERGML